MTKSFCFFKKRFFFHQPKRNFSDFQKFFEISMEDKPKNQKIFHYYSLMKRKSNYKLFRNFFCMNFVIIFGLLIIPGSKVGPQYWLKFWLNDIYTDILMTINSFHKSDDFLEYLNCNLFNSLINLSKDGIYDFEYVTKNINRMNRLLEENNDDKSDNFHRIALLNIGALLNFISNEQIDTLLVEEFQESLMCFLQEIIKKANFKETYEFINDKSNLISEYKYSSLVDSYKQIINIANVLLLYQKNINERALVYQLLTQLFEKKSIKSLYYY